MENEIMVNEETQEIIDVEAVETDETEENNSGFARKLLVGIGIASAIGGAIYWFKNKDELKKKRAERKAEKLRKQGYVVYLPDGDICDEIIDADCDVVDDDE